MTLREAKYEEPVNLATTHALAHLLYLAAFNYFKY